MDTLINIVLTSGYLLAGFATLVFFRTKGIELKEGALLFGLLLWPIVLILVGIFWVMDSGIPNMIDTVAEQFSPGCTKEEEEDGSTD